MNNLVGPLVCGLKHPFEVVHLAWRCNHSRAFEFLNLELGGFGPVLRSETYFIKTKRHTDSFANVYLLFAR